MAWTLFAQGDYESARKYWQRINTENLTTEDHLNIGHLEAATSNIREALTHYRLAQPDDNTEALIRRLEADGDILRSAGITPVKMTLIEEALRSGQ